MGHVLEHLRSPAAGIDATHPLVRAGRSAGRRGADATSTRRTSARCAAPCRPCARSGLDRGGLLRALKFPVRARRWQPFHLYEFRRATLARQVERFGYRVLATESRVPKPDSLRSARDPLHRAAGVGFTRSTGGAPPRAARRQHRALRPPADGFAVTAGARVPRGALARSRSSSRSWSALYLPVARLSRSSRSTTTTASSRTRAFAISRCADIRFLFLEDQRDWRWFPLAYLSFAVDHALFGLDARAPFHRTNLLLHLVNTALVFALVRTLVRDTLVAAVTSAALRRSIRCRSSPWRG